MAVAQWRLAGRGQQRVGRSGQAGRHGADRALSSDQTPQATVAVARWPAARSTATYYRTNVRSAGVAWCAGFGRFGGIGGPIIAASLAFNSIFFVLVALAVLGALLALCVPTSTRTAQREGAANADAREASWSARPSDPLIAPGGPDSPVPPGDCQAAPVAGGRDAARSAIS